MPSQMGLLFFFLLLLLSLAFGPLPQLTYDAARYYWGVAQYATSFVLSAVKSITESTALCDDPNGGRLEENPGRLLLVSSGEYQGCLGRFDGQFYQTEALWLLSLLCLPAFGGMVYQPRLRTLLAGLLSLLGWLGANLYRFLLGCLWTTIAHLAKFFVVTKPVDLSQWVPATISLGDQNFVEGQDSIEPFLRDWEIVVAGYDEKIEWCHKHHADPDAELMKCLQNDLAFARQNLDRLRREYSALQQEKEDVRDNEAEIRRTNVLDLKRSQAMKNLEIEALRGRIAELEGRPADLGEEQFSGRLLAETQAQKKVISGLEEKVASLQGELDFEIELSSERTASQEAANNEIEVLKRQNKSLQDLISAKKINGLESEIKQLEERGARKIKAAKKKMEARLKLRLKVVQKSACARFSAPAPAAAGVAAACVAPAFTAPAFTTSGTTSVVATTMAPVEVPVVSPVAAPAPAPPTAAAPVFVLETPSGPRAIRHRLVTPVFAPAATPSTLSAQAPARRGVVTPIFAAPAAAPVRHVPIPGLTLLWNGGPPADGDIEMA